MAKKRLPSGLYEFLDRGAENEVTLRENSDSIKRVLIRQRVGRAVSNPNFATTLFGNRAIHAVRPRRYGDGRNDLL